ncbi:MAG: competence protein ComEC [Verrucomicrobiota bacterium]
MKLLKAWPRQPFVGLALASGVGILVADFWPSASRLLLIVLAIFAAIAFVSRHSLAVYALVVAGFFSVHSLRSGDTPALRLARELGEQPRPVTVIGHVVSEPKVAPNGSASYLLQSDSVEVDGEIRQRRTKLFARWRHAVEFGDEVKLFGTAEPIGPPRNPGEFDMQSYLARQDVQRQLIVRYPENGAVLSHGGGNPILRAAQQSRRWMQTTLCRDLEQSADVAGSISGMVLGLRHQTPEDIEEPFQQTGTLHLFAVAGLHVGIVARLLWIFTSVIRLPRKWAIAFIIPALLFYAAVTGLHTSSIRAAVMSAVLLAGFLVERRVFALNSLAAAATLLLCWDTNELFSTGFQLSFSVVAAIVLLADPTFRFLQHRFESDPFLPRNLFNTRRRLANSLLSWLARASSVSFAAWIGSLPLMLWIYHLVTPISLLANLVVVPIAFFVLAIGLLSMIVAPFSSWLSIVFNNANWALTKMILGAVHLFAQMPGGHFYLEHPHWPDRARLEINVLDFRSGAAIHVRTRDGDWLFDAGPERDYDRSLRLYLRSRGVNRLEGLVLTHGDAAHIGGAEGTILDFRPRQIIDTTAIDRSPVHRKLIAMLASQGSRRRLCAAGDELSLARDIKARVLFPPRDFHSDAADDQTLVVQLVVSGKPVSLLMSDSGYPTENFLLERYSDLRADLVIKGQHYTGNSISNSFLDRVQPRAIVATSRDFPESERIKEEWVEGIRARGIQLLRQDQTGAVQIKVFRDQWEARSFVTGETFRSTSR